MAVFFVIFEGTGMFKDSVVNIVVNIITYYFQNLCFLLLVSNVFSLYVFILLPTDSTVILIHMKFACII